MTNTLTQYDALIETVDWLAQRERPVAITLTENLEPSGGPGAIVFPATYCPQRRRAPLCH